MSIANRTFVQWLFVSILTVFGCPLSAYSAPGFGPSSPSAFFQSATTPTTPAPHDAAALRTMFVEGRGTYDAATMDGRIYPYPQTQGGVAGAPLLEGCYNSKMERLGNLSDPACATPTDPAARTDKFELRTYYKVVCFENPSAGICRDVGLVLNCTLRHYEQDPLNPFGTFPDRFCNNGTGIVRRARASAEEIPAFEGCYPGQDGTNWQTSCPACADGRFNGTIGENKTGCTGCQGNATIPVGVDAATVGPNDWSTPGFPISVQGGTGQVGATSPGACRLKNGSTWQCLAGFTKKTIAGVDVCDQDPPPCTLQLSANPIHPNNAPSLDNGSIVASYSAASGATNFTAQRTAPTAATLTGSGTNPMTYSNLTAGTYRITVTDSNCSQSVNVTLNDSPPTCTCAPATAPLVCVGELYADSCGAMICNGTKTPCPSPSPTPPASECPWSVYDLNGTLMTSASTPLNALGAGAFVTPPSATNGSSATLTGHCAMDPFTLQLNGTCTKPQRTFTCVNPGAGWLVGPAITLSENVNASGPNPKASGVSGGVSVDLKSTGGAVIGSITLPAVAIAGSPPPLAYAYNAWKKLSSGGASCSKPDGSSGSVSTYATQTFVLDCSACLGSTSLVCGACIWRDPGGVGAFTTSSTRTRCE